MPTTRTKTTKSKSSAKGNKVTVDDNDNVVEETEVNSESILDGQETEDDEEIVEVEHPKKASRVENEGAEKQASSSVSKDKREIKVHVSRFVEYEPLKIVALVCLKEHLIAGDRHIGVSPHYCVLRLQF